MTDERLDSNPFIRALMDSVNSYSPMFAYMALKRGDITQEEYDRRMEHNREVEERVDRLREDVLSDPETYGL